MGRGGWTARKADLNQRGSLSGFASSQAPGQGGLSGRRDGAPHLQPQGHHRAEGVHPTHQGHLHAVRGATSRLHGGIIGGRGADSARRGSSDPRHLNQQPTPSPLVPNTLSVRTGSCGDHIPPSRPAQQLSFQGYTDLSPAAGGGSPLAPHSQTAPNVVKAVSRGLNAQPLVEMAPAVAQQHGGSGPRVTFHPSFDMAYARLRDELDSAAGEACPFPPSSPVSPSC